MSETCRTCARWSEGGSGYTGRCQMIVPWWFNVSESFRSREMAEDETCDFHKPKETLK